MLLPFSDWCRGLYESAEKGQRCLIADSSESETSAKNCTRLESAARYRGIMPRLFSLMLEQPLAMAEQEFTAVKIRPGPQSVERIWDWRRSRQQNEMKSKLECMPNKRSWLHPQAILELFPLGEKLNCALNVGKAEWLSPWNNAMRWNNASCCRADRSIMQRVEGNPW
jgi:hypothetical protein